MDKMVFNIKEVAEQIGVVPATIRNWEKQGLFVPKRNSNGYRMFDYYDIKRLKEIKAYSKDKSMGMEAIRMLYHGTGNQTRPVHEGKGLSKRFLSKKWKQCRIDAGYSLQHVADATDISTSYLSKIENMQANVSLDILNRLADFYGENVLYYIDDAADDNPLVKSGTGKPISVGLEGVCIENLLARKMGNLACMLYTIEPGAGRSELIAHMGEAFVYVLQGIVTFYLDETAYTLHASDSFSFPSSQPHRWVNEGKQTVKLLWIYEGVK
ncbi:MAG: cupin domain-containing protein [Clostridiales Family XIII bacterium]|jgi:DNA-binding transcriptional MerR regulator/quercetin dioxygenase-like cupin family protein|nr:cupin domain-containing protein [Clostridiales Family XIII bacterium]